MISAMSAVSALFTVTSTTPASVNTSGSSDNASWLAASFRSKPSKLVSRSPFASISAITRGRASSATRRPPAASMPPTKQPMLPAPAMPIGRSDPSITSSLAQYLDSRSAPAAAYCGCAGAGRPRLVTVMGAPLCFRTRGRQAGRRTSWVYSTYSTACRTARAAPATPSAQSGGGMSPMTMAILALLAWKAVKHFGGSQPGAAPRHRAAGAPPNDRQCRPVPVAAGGGLERSAEGRPRRPARGRRSRQRPVSGGLGDLLKQLQQKRPGRRRQFMGRQGPNKPISPGDLANALGADQINAICLAERACRATIC